MKTPQEIAAEVGSAYRCLNHFCPGECRECLPDKQDAAAEIQTYGDVRAAAAREEGRREGIEQAANVACRLCEIGEPIIGTVNGRAMHNYYCGGHLSNGKSCRCGPKACEADKIRALASQPKPDVKRTLTGEAAREFLAEMKRIENLPRDSEEYRERAAFLDECRRIYEASKPEPAVTCEGCKRGLPTEVRHVEKISNWVGKVDLYTPCTTKPEGRKES